MPALRVENHGFQKKFRNAVLGYVFPNRAKERKQMAVSEPADAFQASLRATSGTAGFPGWFSKRINLSLLASELYADPHLTTGNSRKPYQRCGTSCQRREIQPFQNGHLIEPTMFVLGAGGGVTPLFAQVKEISESLDV